MILLVDHHAQPVGQKHGGAAAERVLRLEPRQLLAYKMSLVEQRAGRRRQFVEPVHHGLAQRRHRGHRLAHLRQHAQPLAVSRPASKRKALDISRQPDARRKHDVGVLRRTRRANRRRRQAAEKDRQSFHHPNAIAQISRDLELFVVDRATQTLLQFAEHRGSLERLGHRRAVRSAHVPMVALHAT